MNSDPAAARLQIMLQRGHLLRVGQHIASGTQENDRGVLRQVSVIELGGIFGGINGEIIDGAQLLDRRDAVGDGRVPKPGRGGKDQDFEGRGLGVENGWNREIRQTCERSQNYPKEANHRDDGVLMGVNGCIRTLPRSVRTSRQCTM